MVAVKGINDTIKELRKLGKDVEKQIAGETKEIAFQIESDAVKNAPKDNGFLHKNIRHQEISPSKFSIVVHAPYGAYLEFGTGTKVVVPPEMKEIADSFRGKQEGTYEKGLESIEIWCSRKGIDKKMAKWIFWKILKVGINPQPFLYPAFVKGKKDYLTKLTTVLNKFNKKI